MTEGGGGKYPRHPPSQPSLLLLRPRFNARRSFRVTLLGRDLDVHIWLEVFRTGRAAVDGDLGVGGEHVRMSLALSVHHELVLVIVEADEGAFVAFEPGFAWLAARPRAAIRGC